MKRLLCLLIAGGCCASAAAQSLTLDAPIGGWRNSGGQPASHLQDVHYPASRVNAGRARMDDDGVALGAAIRGRIAESAKGKRTPHTLVVNGIPMPISAGEDGRFARPYAFPSGASSVEIKSPARDAVRRVHFYDANPNRRIGLRIVLSWDTDMNDLDLHVVSPDGQHVFYGHRVGTNGGALDVDVTGGFGPEIYAIPSPPKGMWHVYVNYFGGWGGDEDGEGSEGGEARRGTPQEKALTIAQVAIITEEGTLDEKKQVFRVPMRRAGDLTLIKSFLLP